jgi:hypothetical protein
VVETVEELLRLRPRLRLPLGLGSREELQVAPEDFRKSGKFLVRLFAVF